MPGPHDFAVRSDPHTKCFDWTCAACRSFGEGVEAPFVHALAARSQETCPAIADRADAAASTTSHPAFVTTREAPLVRAEMGRTPTGDLPDGLSEIFLQSGLDSQFTDFARRANQPTSQRSAARPKARV
jgi:hypothetical protein